MTYISYIKVIYINQCFAKKLDSMCSAWEGWLWKRMRKICFDFPKKNFYSRYRFAQELKEHDLKTDSFDTFPHSLSFTF